MMMILGRGSLSRQLQEVLARDELRDAVNATRLRRLCSSATDSAFGGSGREEFEVRLPEKSSSLGMVHKERNHLRMLKSKPCF